MKKFVILGFFLASFSMIFPGKASPVETVSRTDVYKALPEDYKSWKHKVAGTCAVDADKAFKVSVYAKIQDGKTTKEVSFEMLLIVETVDILIDSSQLNETLIVYMKVNGLEDMTGSYGYLAIDNQWKRYNLADKNEEKEFQSLADEVFQKHYGATEFELTSSERCPKYYVAFSEFNEKLSKAIFETVMKTEEFKKEYEKSP